MKIDNPALGRWSNEGKKLKNEYSSNFNGEVKTYKWSKEKIDKHLKELEYKEIKRVDR